MKNKICGICLKEFPTMWKAKTRDKPQMCRQCAQRDATPIGDFKMNTSTYPQVGDVYEEKEISYEPNGAPYHKNFRVVSVNKSKPIAPISNKRKEALKRYRRLRDKYFLDHPVCEYPECSSTNITLHHSRGRIGSFLTDKRYFKSLCPKHHSWAEENPLEAQKLGLSFKRLDKHS